MKLNPVHLQLQVSLNDMPTISMNEEELETAIDSLLSFFKNTVVETTGESSESVNGGKEVTEEVAEEQKQAIVEYLNTISGASYNSSTEQAINDTINSVTSVTGTYETTSSTSSAYLWFEGDEILYLWNTGISNASPVVKCMCFQTDGTTKKIKFYTTKELYDNMMSNYTSNTFYSYIEDINETVTSPTGNTYYIFAQCSGQVGAAAWSYVTPWISLATLNVSEDLVEIWNGWGFSVSSSSEDWDITVSEEDTATTTTTYTNVGIATEDGVVGSYTTTDEEEAESGEQSDSSDDSSEDTTTVTVNSIKEKMKQSIKQATVPSSCIILYTASNSTEESEIAKSINAAKEIVDKLLAEYEENGTVYESYDDLSDEIKESMDISKLEEFLESLDNGQSESEAAEDAAYALVNALNGQSTSNSIANAILDQMDDSSDDDSSDDDSSKNGLKWDIYDVLSSNEEDLTSMTYSTELATVIGKYFMTGVSHIAVHTGGACIAGVGTSLTNTALQSLTTGASTIQQGTTTTDLFTQCQAMSDGMSTMIANATTVTMVVGTMTSGNSVIPFVGTGTANGNTHTSVKVIIYAAALASAIILNAGAALAMALGAGVSAVSLKAFNTLIDTVISEIEEKEEEAKTAVNELSTESISETINSTETTVKEKAEQIQSKANELKESFEEKAQKLETKANEMVSKISSKIKQVGSNSIGKKFGDCYLSKVEDSTDEISDSVSSTINSKISSSMEQITNLSTVDVESLTDEQAQEIVNQAQETCDTVDSLKSETDKVFDKIDILTGLLKTISSVASLMLGVTASELYEKVIGIPDTFGDANELSATLLAAAVKASIALTNIQPTETTAGSTGVGLALPIGP